MYIDLHVNYGLLLFAFNESWLFSRVFRKIFKFHENPSIWSRVVRWGRTDMTKLTVAFNNFANEPSKGMKNCEIGTWETQFCVFRLTRSADNIIESYTIKWVSSYTAQSSDHKTPLNKWKWFGVRSIKMRILWKDLIKISP